MYLPWTRIRDAVDVATPILDWMARESFYQVRELRECRQDVKIRNEDQRGVPPLTSKSQPRRCRLRAFASRIATVPAGIRRKRQWFRCNLDSRHRTTHQANWDLLRDHCGAGRICRRAGSVWIQGLLCTYVGPFLSGHSLMHVNLLQADCARRVQTSHS